MLFGASKKKVRVDDLVEFFNGKIRDASRVFFNSELGNSLWGTQAIGQVAGVERARPRGLRRLGCEGIEGC